MKILGFTWSLVLITKALRSNAVFHVDRWDGNSNAHLSLQLCFGRWRRPPQLQPFQIVKGSSLQRNPQWQQAHPSAGGPGAHTDFQLINDPRKGDRSVAPVISGYSSADFLHFCQQTLLGPCTQFAYSHLRARPRGL